MENERSNRSKILESVSQSGSANKPTEAEISEGSHEYPILEFHVDKYLEHIKDIDMSDDEAREYLRTYFQILVGFVDLNFDIHPICQVLKKSDDTPNPLAPAITSLLIEEENNRDKQTNLDKEENDHGND